MSANNRNGLMRGHVLTKRPHPTYFDRDRPVFSTGQVAAICHCAVRTVTKLIDQGVLQGYRIPGGKDRRVTRDSLVRFLRDNNLPVPPELGAGPGLLLVGLDPHLAQTFDGPHACLTHSTFRAGAVYQECHPAAVVVDVGHVGMAEARGLALYLRAEPNPPRLLALLPEDRPLTQLEGYDAVLCQPVDPALLLREVTP